MEVIGVVCGVVAMNTADLVRHNPSSFIRVNKPCRLPNGGAYVFSKAKATERKKKNAIIGALQINGNINVVDLLLFDADIF